MSQIGYSIIPPEKKLIENFLYHARRHDEMESEFHLLVGDYISSAASQECHWHRTEADKLKKVLDVLYPEWEKQVQS